MAIKSETDLRRRLQRDVEIFEEDLGGLTEREYFYFVEQLLESYVIEDFEAFIKREGLGLS